jgi:GT2 family glycosyltransferase
MTSTPTGVADIAVVIPTFQRVQLLPALLEALSTQTLPPDRFEVVLVDDCSDVDVAPRVHAVGPFPYRLQVLRTPRNAGPAAARNLGWRATSAPLLAFLDDDCVPSPGWLEAGLNALTEQPEVGVLQGRTMAPDGVDISRLGDWYIWRIVEHPEPEYMACNIFYRRAAFETTGGFDEVIGWWGEDTAAAWRVLEAGWDAGFAMEASVTHPVERRGWAFFVRNGLLEDNMVRLGVEHPGYRAEKYWRSWAYRPDGPALLAALVGVALAKRKRSALVLALPYLWRRRPSMRQRTFFRLCLQVPVVDAARVVGHARGSIRHRTLVL